MPSSPAPLPPAANRAASVREQRNSVDKEQRPAVHADVVGMSEVPYQVANDSFIVLGTVLLGDQDLVLRTVPAASPVLVGPTEAEGKVRSAGPQHPFEWHFQQPFPTEPVVVVAEAVDAVATRQFGLMLHDIDDPKVVETEVGRQAGLKMALENRRGLADVRPLGEALAPPLVVLGDGMKLWQVERDQPDRQLPRDFIGSGRNELIRHGRFDGGFRGESARYDRSCAVGK